jgi:hypothetical protein
LHANWACCVKPNAKERLVRFRLRYRALAADGDAENPQIAGADALAVFQIAGQHVSQADEHGGDVLCGASWRQKKSAGLINTLLYEILESRRRDAEVAATRC